MTPLYRRLKDAGLSRKYVKKLLPLWWEDKLASNRITYLHGLGSLVKHLGLPLDQMLDDSAELSPDQTAPAAFKRRNNSDITEFTWAKAIAISAAQHAVASLSCEYTPPSDSDPLSIREAILSRGHRWVSLPGLLDYCWDHGIPVLHLSEFPQSKMEGLAIYTDDGPAIVLTLRRKQHAWLLFHLAHELGHIMRRHVIGEDYVDDASIDPTDEEKQEAEANAFAVGLLTGDEEAAFVHDKGFIPPQKLANSVVITGEQYGIDPGVVLLNYIYHRIKNDGFSSSLWGFANKVLNTISPNDDAPQLIKDSMKARLDLAKIPPESADVLMKLCEIRS